MIGAIAGDIIGSRFEGSAGPEPDFALFHPRCRFTDDTVCTLAVAEAILEQADFGTTLKSFVRRHPHRGYGGMFRQWALSEAEGGYGSWGNGAPMRVAAVGWLAANEAEADRLAAAQAEASHNHPDAIAAAQAVARAILWLRAGATASVVRDRIQKEFGYDLRPEMALKGGGFDISAAGTAPAALAAALEAETWEKAVRTAVCLGGDTDTLACIAGAVAEARFGVPADVAEHVRGYLTEDLREVLIRFDRRVSEQGRLALSLDDVDCPATSDRAQEARPMLVSFFDVRRDRFWLRMQAETEAGIYTLSLGFWIRTPVGLFHVFDCEAGLSGASVFRPNYRRQDAFRPARLPTRQELINRIPPLLRLGPISKREVFGIAHFLTEVERFERLVRAVELPKVLQGTGVSSECHALWPVMRSRWLYSALGLKDRDAGSLAKEDVCTR